MKFFLISTLLIAIAAFTNGCSSDSDSSGTTSSLNELSSSVVAAKTNIAKAGVFSSGSALTKGSLLGSRTAANWTATNLDDLGDSTCGTTTSPKGLLAGMSSSTCTTSPFFDLNNMIDMMCVITNELTLVNGLPEAGTFAITISAATATSCGVSDASGVDMTVTVAATSSQTTYQRYVSFSANGDRSLYIGASGTATNIAFTYTEGSSSAYRGYYTTDSATKLTRFELQGNHQSSSNITFFRVLLDESESPGEVIAVGTRNDEGSGEKYTRWSYTAPLDASDLYGVAVAWNGHVSGNASSTTCVDPSDDFSATGNSSQNCGDDDFSAKNITAFSSLADDAFTAISAQSLSTFVNNVGESDVISWDDSNIESDSIID